MKFSKAEWAALGLTGAALVFYAVCVCRDISDRSYAVSGAYLRQAVVSAAPRVYTPEALIDVNTATLDQLMLLPGVGQTKAQAILDYLESVGPFTAPEELMNVPGIGPATYEELALYITLSQP